MRESGDSRYGKSHFCCFSDYIQGNFIVPPLQYIFIAECFYPGDIMHGHQAAESMILLSGQFFIAPTCRKEIW
jgi:hypothetical protein